MDEALLVNTGVCGLKAVLSADNPTVMMLPFSPLGVGRLLDAVLLFALGVWDLGFEESCLSGQNRWRKVRSEGKDGERYFSWR